MHTQPARKKNEYESYLPIKKKIMNKSQAKEEE